MTEKQINKWLRRRFSPLGGVLILYYLLINILNSVAMAADLGKQALWNLATANFIMDFDWEAVWNNGWGYIAAGFVVMAILYAWKGEDFWGGVWKYKQRRMTFPTLLTALGLCMLAQLLNSVWISLLEGLMNVFGRSLLPMLDSVSGASDTLSMFLYSAVFAPFAEELLFRGYILHSLKPYGKRFAILGSAVLFAVFHGNLLQSPYAFMAGLILGWLALEYSFIWAVALHGFNNLVLAESMERLAEYLPPVVADGLFFGIMAVFSLGAMGMLVAKRAQIRAYRAGEWIDRRCVRCLFTSAGVLLLMAMMSGNMVSVLFW